MPREPGAPPALEKLGYRLAQLFDINWPLLASH
jgi:hypothetical protein